MHCHLPGAPPPIAGCPEALQLVASPSAGSPGFGLGFAPLRTPRLLSPPAASCGGAADHAAGSFMWDAQFTLASPAGLSASTTSPSDVAHAAGGSPTFVAD